jgi:hypothetical protein
MKRHRKVGFAFSKCGGNGIEGKRQLLVYAGGSSVENTNTIKRSVGAVYMGTYTYETEFMFMHRRQSA